MYIFSPTVYIFQSDTSDTKALTTLNLRDSTILSFKRATPGGPQQEGLVSP